MGCRAGRPEEDEHRYIACREAGEAGEAMHWQAGRGKGCSNYGSARQV